MTMNTYGITSLAMDTYGITSDGSVHLRHTQLWQWTLMAYPVIAMDTNGITCDGSGWTKEVLNQRLGFASEDIISSNQMCIRRYNQ